MIGGWIHASPFLSATERVRITVTLGLRYGFWTSLHEGLWSVRRLDDCGTSHE